MSYTPTNWTTGDTITATKLNKLENGVANAGSALITQYNAGEDKLDKTVQEIYDAILSGIPVYVQWAYGTLTGTFTSHTVLAPIIKVYGYQYSDVVRIVASWVGSCSPQTGTGEYLFAPNVILFSASSLNDYPSYYRTIEVKSASLESTTNVF